MTEILTGTGLPEATPLVRDETRSLSVDPLLLAKVGTGAFLGADSLRIAFLRMQQLAEPALDILGPLRTSEAHAGIGFNAAWALARVLERFPKPVQVVASFAGVQVVNAGIEGAQGVLTGAHDPLSAWRPNNIVETKHDAAMAGLLWGGYWLMDFIGKRRKQAANRLEVSTRLR